MTNFFGSLFDRMRGSSDPPANYQPLSTDPTLAAWGTEALQMIDQGFALPGQDLYVNEITPGQPLPSTPAFMWACGVQLSALVAAARAEPAYLDSAQRFARALQRYWTTNNGIGGFDVLPAPKPPDRYYDDNCWITIALAELAALTGSDRYFQQAAAGLQFILSGEDDQVGGGIYWHEDKRQAKHTCSTAPGAVAALRLFELTNESPYLEAARRLVSWTTARLQDEDGLFWDNFQLNGTIERTKWSYNSGMMLRANTLLHKHTGEAGYLREAQRIAGAAINHWIDPATGGVRDGAPFGHLLLEALLHFDDPDWAQRQQVVHRALQFVHDQTRDPEGWYAERWDTPPAGPLAPVRLIDQSSVARIFWETAAVQGGGR